MGTPTEQTKKLIETGIVSEIRIGILVGSGNQYLTYPCRVMVHVFERAADGSILSCSVNDGDGAFVVARSPRFVELTEILPYRYNDGSWRIADVLNSFDRF